MLNWDSDSSDLLNISKACHWCAHLLFFFFTVVRGNIRTVLNDGDLQESVIAVSVTRVYRQKFTLFHPRGHSVKSLGEIRTPLSCGVRPGPGSFLFMGWVHFGDAWLGCAPRYKDFKKVYEAATETHENPCEMALDWGYHENLEPFLISTENEGVYCMAG